MKNLFLILWGTLLVASCNNASDTEKASNDSALDQNGQSYVENNAHLFVFCADLNRMLQSQNEDTQEKMKQNFEAQLPCRCQQRNASICPALYF